MSLYAETIANLKDFYLSVAWHSGLETGRLDNIEYVMNPAGSWPSYILGGDVIREETIREVAGEINQGKLPSFWLKVTGGSDDHFPGKASEVGIRQISYWTGMSLIQDHTFGIVVPDRQCLLDRITGEDDLKEWLEVVNDEVMTGKNIDYRLFRNALAAPEFEFFRITRGKKTISTLLSFCKNDIVGIYMVSTKKDYRGRGFGSWITTEAMDYFIRKGFRKFVLHSTNSGYPVYRKLGFRENCRIGIFWMVGKF
jgi:ribosomal protein S18 acetylase RimI-like enzyme